MPFRKKPAAPQGPVTVMIVGLGNPGREYAGTRHNLGFMVVDELARRLGVRVTDRESKALTGKARHPGDSGAQVLLVKPQTFMNLSGRAAAPLARKHRVESGRGWAVYDELDLPFGRLRIREAGSAGGHNGVASLIADLGTRAVPRFRLGIGRADDDPDPIDHLLSPFSAEERQRLPALVGLGADAVMEALESGIEISMNKFNGAQA